ncbi:FkbM family methyltransferase [Oceanicoccus sagamiensis]|nr:FkbM family methyltransferase [Oceanicoccus sagamiensis]
MPSKLDKLRAFYRFKQDYPFGKFLFPWFRQRIKSELGKSSIGELVRTGNDFLVPVSPLEPATRRVQCRGSIDTGMEWVIKRYAKRNTLAVDVGANVGLLSLLMADSVGDSGRVLAIEPNESLLDYAKYLFQLNAVDNVQVISGVCSDKQGTLQFTIDKDHHSKSMVVKGGEVLVESFTLDTLVEGVEQKVSFIKIDVEGHESQVIKGALAILKHQKPVLVFETGMHTDDDIAQINRMLDDAGYKVIGVIMDWGVDEKSLTETMTDKSHCNVLALPIKNSSNY